MACTITVKREGVTRASYSANTYGERAARLWDASVIRDLGVRDEGGSWTIERSGTVTCSTCGKTV